MTTLKVEHHAALFAWIAQETITRFGEDGKQAILEGVRRYGEERGKRMAARARENGHPQDFSGYLLYGEINFAETTSESQIVQRTPHVEVRATGCDWNDAWVKHGVLEFGRLYCQEIDQAIVRGFNPESRIEVSSTLSDGDDHCRFIFRDGKLGAIDMLKYLWRKRKIGTSMTRPMAFHIADLYRVLSETLVRRFGDKGRGVIDAAMDIFKSEHGAEGVNAVRDQVISLILTDCVNSISHPSKIFSNAQVFAPMRSMGTPSAREADDANVTGGGSTKTTGAKR